MIRHGAAATPQPDSAAMIGTNSKTRFIGDFSALKVSQFASSVARLAYGVTRVACCPPTGLEL